MGPRRAGRPDGKIKILSTRVLYLCFQNSEVKISEPGLLSLSLKVSKHGVFFLALKPSQLQTLSSASSAVTLVRPTLVGSEN